MPEVAQGRYCDRCECRVEDTRTLSEAQLHALADGARTRRTCVRVEREGAGLRLAAGVAAGFLVAVLAGCALPVLGPLDGVEEIAGADADGVVTGVVRDPSGRPLPDALVVVQSTALHEAIEIFSDERGQFAFADLPQGSYTVQVLAGKANRSVVAQLGEGGGLRVNFSVDPDEGALLGMLIEPGMGSDASSSFRASDTVWIEID